MILIRAGLTGIIELNFFYEKFDHNFLQNKYQRCHLVLNKLPSHCHYTNISSLNHMLIHFTIMLLII